MGIKPNDYDSIPAYSTPALPADGYICKVLNAKHEVDNNGKNRIVAIFDIAEGEHKDYFRDKFEEQKKFDPNKKYPQGGTAYIFEKEYDSDRTSQRFKQFTQALTDSGVTLNWDSWEALAESMIQGMIGIVFRREEQDFEGKQWWDTRPFKYLPIEKIASGEYTVPDDKPLQGISQNNNESYDPSGAFSQTEDDIPF